MNKIKAIRGMNDVLPSDSGLWQHVESVCSRLFASHLFSQIRMPIVENTRLFSRSIGDETDIVAKEMYVFEDRNGDSLALRPEGTASCVRAGIEHGLFYNQQQRLWYVGPMFRYERPQKGRYRQFHQIGAEVYGWQGADIEAQVLLMTAQLWQELGLKNTHLQINSLGDESSRANYRSALVDYLMRYQSDLDADSQRRLTSNPLRILDSKVQQTQAILQDAPQLSDYLSDQSKQSFAQLQQYLDDLGIKYEINQRLVRGLDYYNNTVFEWVNQDFGAQATVCAGGRYDRLVEQLGGQATPAFGFALGLERLIQMLQEQQGALTLPNQPSVYLISVGEQARAQALCMTQRLTSQGIKVHLHCGQGSMKNQFKKADKSGASLALIIGEDEASHEQVTVKHLFANESQQIIAQSDVLNTVTKLFESL